MWPLKISVVFVMAMVQVVSSAVLITQLKIMIIGGAFLDYRVLDGEDPKHGLHLGILIVELGVGITVTMAILAVFYAFGGRKRN